MRLTVLGATGRTGLEVVRQALDEGHEVTAVVRDPARLPVRGERSEVGVLPQPGGWVGVPGVPPAKRGGVPPAGGWGKLTVATVLDLTDAEALRPLVAGRDAVLSGLGPAGRKTTGIAEAGTRAVVRAMEAAGTRRVVTISAAPVGPPADGESFLGRKIVFPLIGAILKDVYRDLAAMEDELRRSALDWTAVRPGNLTNSPFSGRYRKAVGANVPNAGSLGRADLARAMLDVVGDPATLKQVVGVGAAKG